MSTDSTNHTDNTRFLMDVVEEAARERDMDEVELLICLSEMQEVYIRVLHDRLPADLDAREQGVL